MVYGVLNVNNLKAMKINYQDTKNYEQLSSNFLSQENLYNSYYSCYDKFFAVNNFIDFDTVRKVWSYFDDGLGDQQYNTILVQVKHS